MEQTNAGFGIPSPEGFNAGMKVETLVAPSSDMDREARIAALRARAAEIAAADESDEDMLARFVAEAKAARTAALQLKATEQAATVTAPATVQSVGRDHNGFPREYFKININRGQPQELSYVPVGVQGVVYKIRRGVDVIVPSVVLHALDNAVQDATIQVWGENGRPGGLIFQSSMRFPYNNKGPVSIAEYDAYSARMKAENQSAEALTRAA